MILCYFISRSSLDTSINTPGDCQTPTFTRKSSRRRHRRRSSSTDSIHCCHNHSKTYLCQSGIFRNLLLYFLGKLLLTDETGKILVLYVIIFRNDVVQLHKYAVNNNYSVVFIVRFVNSYSVKCGDVK